MNEVKIEMFVSEKLYLLGSHRVAKVEHINDLGLFMQKSLVLNLIREMDEALTFEERDIPLGIVHIKHSSITVTVINLN
jgi:hypothetical protein